MGHEKKRKLEKSPEGKKPAGIKEVAISKTTDDSKIEKTQTKPKTLSNNDISENKTREAQEKEAKKEKEQQKESKEIEKIKEENEHTVLKKATPANNISPNVPKQKVEESKKTKTTEYESKTLERQ